MDVFPDFAPDYHTYRYLQKKFPEDCVSEDGAAAAAPAAPAEPAEEKGPDEDDYSATEDEVRYTLATDFNLTHRCRPLNAA